MSFISTYVNRLHLKENVFCNILVWFDSRTRQIHECMLHWLQQLTPNLQAKFETKLKIY